MISIREVLFKPLTRSSGWSRVRREHLKNNPTCACCGRKTNLEVHHIQDYSENPELELDHNNLITLCAGATKCHFTFGHLGSWRSINPNVISDTNWFLEKVKNRR